MKNMVKFVIVDDDEKEIKHIEKLLKELFGAEMIMVAFTQVNASLHAEIENVDMPKIYILDIELGNKVSGISIAKLIRKIDWESEIIFITNHDKMFESVHRSIYNVFDFIEKFHDFDKRFKKDIKEIVKRNFDNKMFSYKANNVDLNVYYKHILYIYRDKKDRKLVMVTDSNTFTVSMSLKEILPMLDGRFKQCHRSCIFNTLRVEQMNFKEGYFLMDNGMKVDMLSKKFRKDLEE